MPRIQPILPALLGCAVSVFGIGCARSPTSQSVDPGLNWSTVWLMEDTADVQIDYTGCVLWIEPGGVLNVSLAVNPALVHQPRFSCTPRDSSFDLRLAVETQVCVGIYATSISPVAPPVKVSVSYHIPGEAEVLADTFMISGPGSHFETADVSEFCGTWADMTIGLNVQFDAEEIPSDSYFVFALTDYYLRAHE